MDVNSLIDKLELKKLFDDLKCLDFEKDFEVFFIRFMKMCMKFNAFDEDGTISFIRHFSRDDSYGYVYRLRKPERLPIEDPRMWSTLVYMAMTEDDIKSRNLDSNFPVEREASFFFVSLKNMMNGIGLTIDTDYISSARLLGGGHFPVDTSMDSRFMELCRTLSSTF